MPRGSEWQPYLTSVIQPPTGVTVEYSMDSNICLDELAGSSPLPFPSGCNNPNWSSITEVGLPSVTAVKFDFGSIVLNQGDEVCIDFHMRTPLGVGANEIAWNSFAYVGQNANTGGPLLPAEPIKVGIQTEPIGTLPFDGESATNFLDCNDCFDPICPCYAPFVCNDRLFQSLATLGNSNTFSLYEIETEPVDIAPIFNLTNNGLDSDEFNSIGFNPVDNFIYGIESMSPYRLYRINALGQVESLGTISGLNRQNQAGTFSPFGVYYVTGRSGRLFSIDINLSLIHI